MAVVPKTSKDDKGDLNLRQIPRELIYRLKQAAAVERKTVKRLLIELIQAKFQQLERKGLLPKGK